jgi:hypothetical protein
VTRATGRAYLYDSGHTYTRPVEVTLSRPVLRPAGYKIYAKLAYTLRGPIPRGLHIRRHAVLHMP